MSARPQLRAVRSPRKPSLSQVKKALRLYRGHGVPKQLRHANARKWLIAMAQLGDKHTLHRSRPPVRWGVPGDVVTSGIHAPRRLGEVA